MLNKNLLFEIKKKGLVANVNYKFQSSIGVLW